MAISPDELRERAAAIPWYQSIELPGGLITRGDYDMADALERVPFPASLAGLRCLDVGTRDGFWAFEMERRGAAEVVATDLVSQSEVDLPEPRPSFDAEHLRHLDDRNASFELAREALDSRVEWKPINVYDLTPERVGSFDFAFVGSLLLHLRNPVDALSAVRGVLAPDGRLMSNNPISLPLTVKRPLWPAADLFMNPNLPYFYVPNARGHVRMVEAAGFDVMSAGRPYLLRYGEGWARRGFEKRLAGAALRAIQLVGAPHTCVVGRPRRA
ncbi:MAG: class I SAM-dependent methyltransferase [Solirubrobacteraceae bacterium MAG38_C4-C5]|nr:class I SAM-dependent methyltransferase [Candidatus Siliceabacter maunaloa]